MLIPVANHTFLDVREKSLFAIHSTLQRGEGGDKNSIFQQGSNTFVRYCSCPCVRKEGKPTRTDFLIQWHQLLWFTPQFKAISDLRQNKFSQPVIQNKHGRKLALIPVRLTLTWCGISEVLKSKSTRQGFRFTLFRQAKIKKFILLKCSSSAWVMDNSTFKQFFKLLRKAKNQDYISSRLYANTPSNDPAETLPRQGKSMTSQENSFPRQV